jgi:hypothetical protein
MTDFFRGWRRKAGVLTLVLACVFMAGWIRSQSMFDQFCYPTSTWYVEFDSFKGLLHWNTVTVAGDISDHPFAHPPFGHSQVDAPKLSISLLPIVNYLSPHGWSFRSRWEMPEFAFAVATKGNVTMSVLAFPYWSIVIPLTLLSAYLLLIKPRAKQPPEVRPTSEPVP